MLPGMPPSNGLPNKPNLNEAQRSDMFDQLDHFELWFSVSWRWLWRGSLVIVLIAIVAFVVIEIKKSGREQTNMEFASIEANAKLSADEKTAQLEAKVAEKPNAEAATIARMSIAKNYADKGNFAKAIEVLDYIKDDATAQISLRTRAGLNKAYILLNEGKNDEAIAQIIETRDNGNINQQVMIECSYALALIYQKMGKNTEFNQVVESMQNAEFMGALRASPYQENVIAIVAAHRAAKEAEVKVPPAPIKDTAIATPIITPKQDTAK